MFSDFILCKLGTDLHMMQFTISGLSHLAYIISTSIIYTINADVNKARDLVGPSASQVSTFCRVRLNKVFCFSRSFSSVSPRTAFPCQPVFAWSMSADYHVSLSCNTPSRNTWNYHTCSDAKIELCLPGNVKNFFKLLTVSRDSRYVPVVS